MKNILYFIHVPWKWIKQRPHFIAEGLAINNDVTVCESMPFQKEYRGAESPLLKIKTYFQLPKDRIPIVHFFNKVLFHLLLRKEMKQASVIWITNPAQYPFINKNKTRAKVVYDCMDDLPEFEPTLERRQKLETLEGKLYNEADVVIASSNYLKGKLEKRYGKKDIFVVNNAIKQMQVAELKPLPLEIKDKMQSGKYVISYIGTIEKWIDLDLVKEIVEQFPEVVFCFFGPLKVELPRHDRIKYCGCVPHDMVFSVMDNSDALIMPFVLNELILSVNPVKLYEYIYSGKPCLAPRYGESETFGEYAYLYNSKENCCGIIKSLINGTGAKQNAGDCKAFAMSNTWKERVEQIETLIKGDF